MDVNKIYNESCLDTLKRIKDRIMRGKTVLVGTEPGKHCDIFPAHSIHQVTEENKGAYRVPFHNNNYLRMDWVNDHDYKGDIDPDHRCNGCDNIFLVKVAIIDGKCPRCINRKTRVNK